MSSEHPAAPRQATMAMRACPFCHVQVPQPARKCKSCGEWIVGRARFGTFALGALLLAGLAIAASPDARSYLGFVATRVATFFDKQAHDNAVEQAVKDIAVPFEVDGQYADHGFKWPEALAAIRNPDKGTVAVAFSKSWRRERDYWPTLQVVIVDESGRELAQSQRIHFQQGWSTHDSLDWALPSDGVSVESSRVLVTVKFARKHLLDAHHIIVRWRLGQ